MKVKQSSFTLTSPLDLISLGHCAKEIDGITVLLHLRVMDKKQVDSNWDKLQRKVYPSLSICDSEQKEKEEMELSELSELSEAETDCSDSWRSDDELMDDDKYMHDTTDPYYGANIRRRSSRLTEKESRDIHLQSMADEHPLANK